MDVNPGIASSYIFTLKPGDKVTMSGPYGDFHPIFDSKKEMIWVGGGAGMAPLRAQIMHMTKTLHTTDRELHYFYGARALNEVFYLPDFQQLEKDFPNFPLPSGFGPSGSCRRRSRREVHSGFVHNVMYETYLKDHDAPEDIEYYMCGPGPMSKAVVGMLDGLGVDPDLSCTITSADSKVKDIFFFIVVCGRFHWHTMGLPQIFVSNRKGFRLDFYVDILFAKSGIPLSK